MSFASGLCLPWFWPSSVECYIRSVSMLTNFKLGQSDDARIIENKILWLAGAGNFDWGTTLSWKPTSQNISVCPVRVKEEGKALSQDIEGDYLHISSLCCGSPICQRPQDRAGTRTTRFRKSTALNRCTVLARAISYLLVAHTSGLCVAIWRGFRREIELDRGCGFERVLTE
jgi:hypothetical protein